MKVLLKKIFKFVKEVIKFYTSIAGTVFPRTNYFTHFVPRTNFKEYLEIHTTWLGQQLKSETFELAHREERKKILDYMLKEGDISPEEYKKCLPPE